MKFLRKVRGGWASAAAAATAPAPTVASVDTYTIRHRFNFDWAMHQDEFTEEDTYSWWATSIRVDPDEVWAEDYEGNLWVVPFSTDGADEVTFGTPERARLVAVPVAASAGVQANQLVGRARQRVLAVNLERPDKPGRTPNPTTAAVPPDTEGSTDMDDAVREALARAHGLDPAASVEDVNAAVLAAQAEPQAPETPEVEAPAAEVEHEAVPELAAAAAALGLPATATAEEIAATATEIRRGSEAGATVARSLEVQALDQAADAAVADGRIFPSARDSWRSAMDPGENPTPETIARAAAERQALAALSPNRVPVRERGATPDANAAGGASLTRALSASGLTRNRSTNEEVTRRV